MLIFSFWYIIWYILLNLVRISDFTARMCFVDTCMLCLISTDMETFFSKQLSSIECCVGSIKWIANTIYTSCVDVSLSQRWAWNNIQITNLFVLGKCHLLKGIKLPIHHQSTKVPVSRFNLAWQVWLYQTCVIQFGLCTSRFSLKK